MQQKLEKHLSHKHPVLFGVSIIIIVFVILGGWAFFAKMDLSIQAPGEIRVQSYPKSVKSIKGGTIKYLYVNDGDIVTKEQILLELDTNQVKSQLEATQQEYQHLLASKARIRAELDNKTIVNYPENIRVSIKEEENSIFENRTHNLQKQLDDIEYQITITKENIISLTNTIKSKILILESYKKELNNWNKLYEQGLVDELKLLDLQRKIDTLNGDIESIKSQINQKESSIAELKNKLTLLKSNYKKELLAKLKDINSRLPSVESKISVLKDEIKNSQIKSPSDGIVQNMQIHSPNEVISPYKEILQIIPKSDKLIIEAKVNPTDIEKVKVGEMAEINFASFVDPSALPIEGKVIYVSADIIKDERDPRVQYYKALIKITPNGLEAIRINKFDVIPGMPVTVFIKAGQRTFLSYILYPLKQLIKGAFHAN